MTPSASLTCFLRRVFLRIFLFVLSAAAIAALMHDPAAAQELSRTSFTKFASNACPTSGNCFVDFGTVPGTARRRYEITSVSCYLSIGNVNGRVLYWYLYGLRNGELVGRIHLRATHLGATTNAVTYNATEQGLLVVPGGGTLGVSMARDGTTAGAVPNMDCTIGGYDVRLQ